MGVVKTYRVLHPCRINLKIDRTRCLPWGVQGGLPGQPSDVVIFRADGREERVLKGDHALLPGDRVQVKTAGGGGYGNPFEREVERVMDDLSMGYITREAARSAYGVVVNDQGALDLQATLACRADLQAHKELS